ncbi:Pycsar system effector family protein [Hymenobacter sp. BT559]|uniref:Pycsar system effector family protein n=1 Tax=Hymenobacter sp. BT559 TaxID=2795729 RepID=UPI0018ECB334|nr:Pycsar system effector family protein [Hymenobacter sp. BT559]MBJ6143096.1 HD domain-containing protein [Hymenobacter sp. BT559]
MATTTLPATDAEVPAGAPALPAAAAPQPPKPPKSEPSALVQQARAAVEPLLKNDLDPRLTYHSLAHTAYVVKQAHALADAAKLPPADTELLLVAAWFHDTGYLDTYDGHEYKSMARAEAWLREKQVDPARIEVIKNLIRATHRNEEATTELEKIMVDADMSNLAAEDFRSRAELIRTEWELCLGKSYTNPEWAELQLDFMLGHKYQSEAGKDRYKKALKTNIEDQRDYLKKTEKKAKKKEKKATDTFAEPKRGIETMFRTMYSNHMKLSDMADKKASMMIQLNAVILSVIITYFGAKSSSLATTGGTSFIRNPILAVPMGILLCTALGSVISAILSAQPDVTSFKWLKRNPEIATNRRVNLLFFGQFTKLSLQRFQEGMRELMRQKDTLYNNMVTDVYYLGEVLDRKYRLLRVSYSIFMVGLILTALSFAIVLAYKM